METYRHEEKGENQLHNVAYFIDDKGDILGRYQKKNLWYCILFPQVIRLGKFPCLQNKIAEPTLCLHRKGIQKGPT